MRRFELQVKDAAGWDTYTTSDTLEPLLEVFDAAWTQGWATLPARIVVVLLSDFTIQVPPEADAEEG